MSSHKLSKKLSQKLQQPVFYLQLSTLSSLSTQLIAARSAFASTRGGASATVANKLGDDGSDDDFVRCSTPVAAASGLIGPSFLFPFGVIWPPPAFFRSSLSFARCNRASAARVARPAETGGRSAFGSRE